ncbi:MAG: NYN domain-containing protein [Richelia sp. SM1_7_0]|nr:NYN domain-containing protein [Richelia sp. SM1_7_0]
MLLCCENGTTERFSKEPSRATNLAKVLVRFCKQLQHFDKGNIICNLEIAIAGYEVAMSVFSIEAFPLERGGIQSGLNSALKQREEVLAAKNNAKTEAEVPQVEAPKQKKVVDSEVAPVEAREQSSTEVLSEELQELQEAKPAIQEFQKPVDNLLIPNSQPKEVQNSRVENQDLKQEENNKNLHPKEIQEKAIAAKHITQETVKLEQNENLASLLFEVREVKQRQVLLEQLLIKVNASPTVDKFNTAIFYDIENLTKGRQNPNIGDFSLREIKENIEKNPVVNKIALQSAYADWSNSRLTTIKREIQELGIETAQIFGLGFERNVADIQLVIDVVELIHSRPSIEVFVIVSGDGAFASLAKKLHEYGKTVIACGYEGQVNRILKSVCDEFIPISNSQERVESINAENHHLNGNGNGRVNLASV